MTWHWVYAKPTRIYNPEEVLPGVYAIYTSEHAHLASYTFVLKRNDTWDKLMQDIVDNYNRLSEAEDK